MHTGAGLELLTTTEAADYLRIKERKLYELIAERQVPCTKVTGKWLFSRADLDRWLLAGMARPYGVVPAEPPPIIGGSHDPLLQWALSESRAGLAILPEGSEVGYQRFLNGGLLAAAVHFHDLADTGKDANPEIVAREAHLYDAVLIGFAAREQGLIVAAGNPLGIARLREVHGRRLRMAVRPEGAGAQQLLEGLLHAEHLPIEELKTTRLAPTGPDVAQAIRAGQADCGIATRAVATAAGLDFVLLCVEHFDLLMRQRDYFRPPMQKFLRLLADPRFAARAKELGGLDVTAAGSVRWSP
jgi:excisionase family DNA binding protein